MDNVIPFHTLIRNNEIKERHETGNQILRDMAGDINPLDKMFEEMLCDYAMALCDAFQRKRTFDLSLTQDFAIRMSDMVEDHYES